MHVAIIGNGIAGCTLATTLRASSDFQITLISEESLVPYARTALMYLFSGDVRWEDTLIHPEEFWQTVGIQRIMEKVSQVNTTERYFTLASGQKIDYDILVLATGSKPHRPSWWSENLDGISSLYHLEDLSRITNQVKENPTCACIAGGGLIGVELAEMLHQRRIPTTMIVREPSFMSHWLPPEESAMISSHLAEKGVAVLYREEVEQLIGQHGRIEQVRLKSNRVLPCQFLGVTTGVLPNTELVEQTAVRTGRGILVDERLETSVPGVYAIGDCAELRYPATHRQGTEAVWYVAREMGRQLAEILLHQRSRYEPKCWFNSTSFFSLQLHVYGAIQPGPGTDATDLFWQHPGHRISVRIQADYQNNCATGILSVGLRLRHAVCEQWITQKVPLETILRDWNQAVFEPEFSQRHTAAIQNTFVTVLNHIKLPTT